MAKILIGFMGAGKTTVASLLDENFIDMDELLSERLEMPIKEYFEQYGEAAFRQKESELLKELLQSEQVISTGGGIISNAQNRELLKQNAENIYLKTDFETLYQRLEEDQEHQRPLYLNNSKSDLKNLFEQRQTWYEEVATKVIDVTTLTPKQIVEVLQ